MLRTSSDLSMVVVAHPVIMDLKVCMSSSTAPPSTFESTRHIWHLIKKDLYLYTFQEPTWLYVELANEEDHVAGDLMITDIRVDELNQSLDRSWESRPGWIWMLRSKFSGKVDQAVTDVNVLFGVDVVDPRS